MRKYLFVLWLCCFAAFHGFSQTVPGKKTRILTRDGNEYIGNIVSQDSLSLRLATESIGEITILRADIRRQEEFNTQVTGSGARWEENRLSGKYFVSSSAHNVRKGEGYYQNVFIFYNQVTYGVTDYWSVSAGAIPVFLFNIAPTPVWMSTKFSLPVVKDRFTLGAGALLGVVLGDGTSFGLLSGNGTIGGRDRNMTVSLGWAIADGEFAPTPTFSLSGMYRTSKRWYLMTENYYIDVDDEQYAFMSFGARYLARNIGIDFGGGIPVVSGSGFIIVPWLGVVVPFGRRK